MTRTRLAVERLEPRLAPAVAIVSPTVATFTDVDGDFVTVTASRPVLDAGDFDTAPAGRGDQLRAILLADDGPAADGLNLTVTAVRRDGDGDAVKDGDGRANVGRIDAGGRTLGTVTIPGDLGQITAGNGSTVVPALKSLTVGSMGMCGTDTGAASLVTQINGPVGTLTVKGDLRAVTVQTLAGGIGAIKVAGDFLSDWFVGGAAGELASAGDVGTIQIGGSITGLAQNTPLITVTGGTLAGLRVGGSSDAAVAAGAIGTVSVGGDLRGRITSASTFDGLRVGGSVLGARVIAFGRLGSVAVGGDVVGGGGGNTGLISTLDGGAIGRVSVGGSIVGGLGANAGRIASDGAMGVVTVGRNVQGGLGDASGTLFAGGGFTSVSVSGSVLGGIDRNVDDLNFAGAGSGVIGSGARLGPVRIGGDLVGGSGRGSGVIGGPTPASVTVGGSVLGGTALDTGRIAIFGGTAPVGRIEIGGDLAAGAEGGGIASNQHINVLTVGGSVVGGLDTVFNDGIAQGTQSGFIDVAGIGTLRIGRSVVGGNAPSSGFVSAFGPIGSVSVGGSLVGGTRGEFAPSRTGAILAGGDIGPVTIGGDVRGSEGYGFPTPDTGTVQGRRIAAVTVGGSVVGGTGPGAVRSGSIHATFDLGPVVVMGSLVHATLTATGRPALGPGATTDLALKSLTVGGHVERTAIRLGYDRDSVGVNADASCGPVRVTGSWRASDLLAGVDPMALGLGNGDEVLLAASNDPNLVASIAGVTIGGEVLGLPGTTNVYGFAAERVESFQAAGATAALTAGAGNDTFALGAAIAVGPSLSPVVADGFAVHVFEV